MSFGDVTIAGLDAFNWIETFVQDLVQDIPAAAITQRFNLLRIVKIAIGQDFEVVAGIRELFIPDGAAVVGKDHGVIADIRRPGTHAFKAVTVRDSRREIGDNNGRGKIGRQLSKGQVRSENEGKQHDTSRQHCSRWDPRVPFPLTPALSPRRGRAAPAVLETRFRAGTSRREIVYPLFEEIGDRTWVRGSRAQV